MSEPLEKIKVIIEDLSVEEKNHIFRGILENLDLLEYISNNLYFCHQIRKGISKELRFFSKVKRVEKIDEAGAMGPKHRLAVILADRNLEQEKIIEDEWNRCVNHLISEDELLM